MTCLESGGSPTRPSLPPTTQTLPASPPDSYERASEVLKQGLMARFGSIVGAYEWFDLNTGGYIHFSEFEKCLLANGVSTPLLVRELFSALDRSGAGRFSVSEFLSEAVKKLNPAPFPQLPAVEPTKSAPQELRRFSDPSTLPAGRRALRTASILAFRNGRYDDAIVSGLQALGITAPTPRWVASLSKHPDNLVELLLLARAFVVTKQLAKGQPFVALIESIMAEIEGSVTAPHVEATLLCSLGELFDEYAKTELAEKFFHQYATMTRSVFGATSLVYGDAVTIVCKFYLKHKQVDVALALANQAIDIRSQNLTSPHARLADAFANLGIVLRHASQLTEAIGALKEAAEQRVKLFGPNSLPAADAFFSIGSVLVQVCEESGAKETLEEAEKYLTASHSVRLKNLGPSHADSIAAAEMLRRLNLLKKPVEAKRKTAKDDPVIVDIENQRPESPKPIRSASKLPISRLGSTLLLIEEPLPAPPEPVPLPEADEAGMTETESEASSSEADANESSEEDDTRTEEGERMSLPASSVGGVARSAPSWMRRASAIMLNESGSQLANPNMAAWQPRQERKVKLILPESPFKQSMDLMGGSEFIDSLLTLHTNVLGTTDFEIESALPSDAPFWVSVSMQSIYAHKLMRQETEADSIGTKIEVAMAAIANQESGLKLVFAHLNSIYVAMNPGKRWNSITGGLKQDLLSVDTFSNFVNSKVQDVPLAEHFRDTFVRKNPGVLKAVMAALAKLDPLVESSFSEYVARTATRRKSINFIQDKLKSLNKDAGGPTEEGQMVLQVVTRKAEITATQEGLEKRSKIVLKGVKVIGELFHLNEAATFVDIAVDCLHELWSLLSAHPASSSDSDTSSEGGVSIPGSSSAGGARSAPSGMRRASAIMLSEPGKLANPNMAAWEPRKERKLKLTLPESPFKQSMDLMGASEFVDGLLTLQTDLLGTTDFEIESALPSDAPFWIYVAMESIYAQKLMRQETGPDSIGPKIEVAMAAIANQESELKLVFALLNSIFVAINPPKRRNSITGGLKQDLLSVDNFSDFINSRTQNVAFADYFRDAFVRKNPGLLDGVMAALMKLDPLVNSSISEYVARGVTRRKSINFVQDKLKGLTRDTGGPTEEGQMVLQVVERKPEIAAIQERLEKRSKIVLKGAKVIGELFHLNDATTFVDLAVDCLHELWFLLSAQPASSSSEDSDDSE